MLMQILVQQALVLMQTLVRQASTDGNKRQGQVGNAEALQVVLLSVDMAFYSARYRSQGLLEERAG